MNAVLIAFIVAVLGSLAAQTSSPSSAQDADLDWALRMQGAARDAVMPLIVPDMVVTYRARNSNGLKGLERYFVSPIGDSIARQLVSLRMNDRKGSLTDLASRLALRKETVYVRSCGAIRVQLDRLPQVRMHIPERNIFRMDGVIHEVALSVLKLELAATILDDNDPIVRWAVRTHELLLRCVPAR